jgi:hypothetical protein
MVCIRVCETTKNTYFGELMEKEKMIKIYTFP